jgi:hypothetical protein
MFLAPDGKCWPCYKADQVERRIIRIVRRHAAAQRNKDPVAVMTTLEELFDAVDELEGRG